MKRLIGRIGLTRLFLHNKLYILLIIPILLVSCSTYPRTVGVELNNIDQPEGTFIEVYDNGFNRTYTRDYQPLELTPEQKAEIDNEVNDYWGSK
jgi:hypothetical protein